MELWDKYNIIIIALSEKKENQLDTNSQQLSTIFWEFRVSAGIFN